MRIVPILVLFCVAQPVGLAADVTWAGSSSGPYRSLDNGSTWQALAANIGQPHTLLSGVPEVSAIAVEPHDPSIVYLAAQFPSGGAAVLKTSDRGATWTGAPIIGASFVGATVSGERRTVLAVDPVAANTLYLQDAGSIFKSGDAGDTWSKIETLPGPPQSRLAIDPSTSGILYIVSQNPAAQYVSTVFRSEDFGETWTAVGAVPEVGTSFRGGLFVSPNDSRILFLAAATTCGSQQCGLLRSEDGGVTWRNLGFSDHFESMAFGPGADDWYATGQLPGLGNVVLRSSDAGGTWNPVGATVTGAGHLVVDPDNGSMLYSLSGSGLMEQSKDGGRTWSQLMLPPLCGPSPVVDPCPFTSVLGTGARLPPQVLAVAMPKPPAAGVTHVSAASFRATSLARGSIATALGQRLSTGTEAAAANPLPTALAGSSITITDSAGARHSAPLFYVSPGQINYLVPEEVATGDATVHIAGSDGISLTRQVDIARVSPGVFTLNRAGLAAATVLRVSGGSQSFEDVYELDGTGAVVARPIQLDPSSGQVYLTIYGTGFGAAGVSGMQVTIGGETAEILFVGAQGYFPGLDQVNLLAPPTLAGRGNVELLLTAAGETANPVRLAFR